MSSASSLGGFLRRGGAFLVVGGVAFVVDAAVFNLLMFGLTGRGPMYQWPVSAKVIAIIVATIVTYVGNRYWTFGARSLPRKASRYVVFVLLNIVAMLIQVGCLAFSRYVFGFEGIVADNVSGTLVGQALATIFRFFTYDKWVFRDEAERSVVDPHDAPDSLRS